MAGLRERQKETRRKSMLHAAMTLFADRGYDAVKLEEIAHFAGVSPGTLYTYFKTKNDLLLAVVVEDFEEGLARGSDTIARPINDALSAINLLTNSHFLARTNGPTSEMWRFAVTAYVCYPKSYFSQKYGTCLATVRGQFVTLIERLKSEGHLPETIDATEFAFLLDSSATLSFLEFIRNDDAPSEVLEAQLTQLNARLVGWAKLGG